MNPQIAPTGQGQPRLDASNVQSSSQLWSWNIQGPFTGVTNLAPGGWSYSSSTNTVTVSAGATVGSYLVIVQTGPASPGNSYYSYYFFDVICMAEAVTIGSPTWNATTNKWDYPVTVTIQGGTSPFTPSRPSTTTVSLSPGASTTFASSTVDSGSCSASSSTSIGPAPIPPGGPSEGPGPSGPNGPDGTEPLGPDDGSGEDGDGECQTCLCPLQPDGSRPDCRGVLSQPKMRRFSEYGQAQHGDGTASTGNISSSIGAIQRF